MFYYITIMEKPIRTMTIISRDPSDKDDNHTRILVTVTKYYFPSNNYPQNCVIHGTGGSVPAYKTVHESTCWE